jgi:hypothetical protein
MLKVINTNTGTTARGVRVINSSGTAPAIDGGNNGSGPAAVFTANGVPAAEFSTSNGAPPFTVNSNGIVSNLNANLLDGVSSDGFLLVNGTAVDSDKLGGVPADGYQRDCTNGAIVAFAMVPASGSFSSSYTPLTGGGSCGTGNFAKRVGQGDYRVLDCGIAGGFNPIALVTDTSFNDFASIQLIGSPDADATTKCGTTTVSEFKVTTRDASGVAQDAPFNFAQL